MALKTTISINDESSFLYRFFTSPKFRISRHVFLFLTLFVISFNLVYIPYQDLIAEQKNRMYPMVLYSLLTYILVAYFNLYYLLPKYLLTKRYGTYIILLLLSAACVLMAQLFQEYFVYSHWLPVGRPHAFLSLPVVAGSISGFLLTTLCLAGSSMTVLLRLWMINNQRVAQLERTRMMRKVEQLKEQFSPVLLFKALNRAGRLALGEPEKASLMLTKLDELLRYQVYDCKQEEVSLGSVVNYLANYLMLEQFESKRFNYVLSMDGEVNRTVVPPLLFLPFVQYMVQRIYAQEDVPVASVHVRLKVDKEKILFHCSCPGVDLSGGDGLEQIKQRLALQYEERYRLKLAGKDIRLELKKGGEI